jgi:anaerobic selenocysteine-containing dehydrogenase
VHNTAKFSDPLFEIGPDAMHEYEIVLALVEGIERRRGRWNLKKRARAAVFRAAGPTGMVDVGLRLGPHGHRSEGLGGLSVAKLRAAPHGIDLGAHVPMMPEGMKKWRERIDLAPEIYVRDLERLRSQAASNGSLSLIGRRHLRSNNSWMHNVPKLMAGTPICTLLMHPDDAEARGIERGARVEVSSRVGAVEIEVELSDEMMPGVVSLPHGFGHDRPKVRLRVAQAHAGVSINDLTDELRIDALCGNAAFSGVPVTVEPVGSGEEFLVRE